MKKILSLGLALLVIFSIVVTVSANESAKSDSNVQIMTEAPNPINELFESIDKSLYCGTYWDGDEFHVIPVPAKLDELSSAISNRTKTRSAYPPIVIDNTSTRSSNIVYSMAQRENGYNYLLEHKDTLNIEAVGYTADKLAVFMNLNATDEDRQNVLAASPVKAIEFYGGGVIGGVSQPESSEEYDEDDFSTYNTRATSTSLRGGNWLRKTSTSNWSTITVSAVRNWNGTSGDIGLLTCGHGWTNGQKVYASDGTKIGTADVRHKYNMDVTFVKLDNTNLNSHGYMKDGTQVKYNRSVTSTDIGLSVEKYGAVTGNTSGTITVIGISGTWGDYEFNNLFLTSISTKGGDSGSPIITGEETILGILKGARANSPSDEMPNPTYYESVILPISDVISEEDLSPCT